jgi:glycosyltransferase involved in cell wall biosynthesis
VPGFSVIIPAYNGASWLPGALESVFAQTCRDYEVIVVDDGSTDDTGALLARYGDGVRVVTRPNGGSAAARNSGVAHAHGDYVVFLDVDDRFLPWTLQHYRDAIAQAGSPALAMCRPAYVADDGELTGLTDGPAVVDRWADYLDSVRAGYRITIASAIRREAYLACGGSRGRMGAEDHDLFLRLGVAPGFLYLRAPVLYAYRQRADGVSRDARQVHAGVRFLLAEERAGHYPGGRARARQRRYLLGRLVRFATRRLVAAGGYREALDLSLRGAPYLVGSGSWREAWRRPVALWRRALLGLAGRRFT